MTATITVELPKHVILSANGREHYMPKAGIIRQLRSIGYWQARATRIAPMQQAHLTVTVAWSTLKRNRDRLNLAPTIKALVDGMIDAGILPDDNDDRILSEHLQTADERCPDGVVLRFDFEAIIDAEIA